MARARLVGDAGSVSAARKIARASSLHRVAVLGRLDAQTLLYVIVEVADCHDSHFLHLQV